MAGSYTPASTPLIPSINTPVLVGSNLQFTLPWRLYLQNLPERAKSLAGKAVTSVSLDAPAEFVVSGSPGTGTVALSFTNADMMPGQIAAGPATGGPAPWTFRALVGTDLPTPSASSLGGVEAFAPAANEFLTGIGTNGAPSAARPTFANLGGAAIQAQLPSGFTQLFGAAAVNCNVTSGHDGGSFAIPASITKYLVVAVYALNFAATPTSLVVNLWTGALATGTEVASYSNGQLMGATTPATVVTGTVDAGAAGLALTAPTIFINVATANGSALTGSFVVEIMDLTGF